GMRPAVLCWPWPMISSTCWRTAPQRLQRPGRHAPTLMDEAKQQVLGADVVVVQHPGFVLSQDHHPLGPVGEPLKHAPSRPSPSAAPQWTSRYIASAAQARYVVSGVVRDLS